MAFTTTVAGTVPEKLTRRHDHAVRYRLTNPGGAYVAVLGAHTPPAFTWASVGNGGDVTCGRGKSARKTRQGGRGSQRESCRGERRQSPNAHAQKFPVEETQNV